MHNPNKSRISTSYELTENVLASLTPNPIDYEGRTYPEKDVKSDILQLHNFKLTPDYKKSGERSDAKLLEKTFTDMAERGDWFGDDELYSDDPDSLALATLPTTEIDDVFNHIDLIGTISNEVTGHDVLPFAIDLTYNIDDEKMTKKFRWKHVYGKKESAPEGISEFGESYIDKDNRGRDVLRTRPLQMKYRYGLKIPGFASAKYFEDKDKPWTPRLETGRINIMPRFIVGYSTDITTVLFSGMPTKEYREKFGEEAYQRKKGEYKSAERRAKWCTLFECHEQASDIRFMLEHMDAEETKWMRPEELEEAKKQIIAMDTYFTKALELAAEKAQTNLNEISAMRHAERDAVHKAIKQHSNDTYVLNNWKQ